MRVFDHHIERQFVTLSCVARCERRGGGGTHAADGFLEVLDRHPARDPAHRCGDADIAGQPAGELGQVAQRDRVHRAEVVGDRAAMPQRGHRPAGFQQFHAWRDAGEVGRLQADQPGEQPFAAGLAGQAYNSQLAGINGKAGLLGDMFRNQLSGYGQQADLANTNFNNRQQGISTLSQLANQSQQMATDPIKTAATAQEAATNTPMKYLAMATGQNAPTQGLLSQLSQQRYSVASPAQTVVRQGSGGFFGGLMSGLGSYFACFTAGTEISTPEGAVAIEQMTFSDQVVSLGAVNEVTELHDMGEADIYELNTPSFAVETTQTEVFMTPDGKKPLTELSEGESVMTVNGFEPITSIVETGRKEKVYELELTGDNMFYANGILAEGLTEADKAGNDPDGDIIPAEVVDVVPAEQKTEDSAEEPMQEMETSAEETTDETEKKPAAKKPATRRKTVAKKAGK